MATQEQRKKIVLKIVEGHSDEIKELITREQYSVNFISDVVTASVDTEKLLAKFGKERYSELLAEMRSVMKRALLVSSVLDIIENT